MLSKIAAYTETNVVSKAAAQNDVTTYDELNISASLHC